MNYTLHELIAMTGRSDSIIVRKPDGEWKTALSEKSGGAARV
ncbi:hypothetical protein ACFV4K_13790 [Nocardia sp. NPDC059764]